MLSCIIDCSFVYIFVIKMPFDLSDSFPSVIVIGGPTASGKTDLAIRLSEKIQENLGVSVEIINADSVQMYKDLKILTAYPSEQELQRVPHHLYGILEPYDSSSLASWLDMAKNRMKKLENEKKIAIICGGTGFYINALFRGVAAIPDIPLKARLEVQSLFSEIGRDAFFEKLKEIDFKASQKLSKNDTQRVLRAYEVAKFTGKTLSEWWKESSGCGEHQDKTKMKVVLLFPERELIREKAAKRIKRMLDSGAIEEVEAFNARNPEYDGPLKETIGYYEICNFLSPEDLGSRSISTYEDLVEKIRIRTNQYIKRQSTWFRNQIKNARIIEDFGNTERSLREAFEECFAD